MAKRVSNRLNETPTLLEILPAKKSASGSEFARIANLLIFYNARRTGSTATILDDRVGDWQGLDAFEKKGKTLIGYQHKFSPSPFSDNHRLAIENSLKITLRAVRKRKFGLTKWILVTPQDLVESSTRKSGGDVSWFNNLRKRLKLPFEIEHWGHTKLQAMFLETPSIGLYYYPELFPDGVGRRKTIQNFADRYERAFSSQYRDIEFVGMSVYKNEAARTVPMENIYIPLTVIPNQADENDPNVQRYNPVDCLKPASCHVILGDPGSGKTTLLRFLALVGHSRALQKRYKFKPDSRMPFLVTLRRYADELKKQDNLGLLEYIRMNIEADFSLPGVPFEFLEYYLESGQAILLFDGVDELPSSSFKKKVCDRIRSIRQTYPGNTIVVTSRIYGYEGACRFREKEFAHHRLAKLQIAEIEQFIIDWYQARIEKPREREDHIRSLTGILRNKDHHAICELARNPLLLTIVVLVHRIDAVLPDERHVLYQKCTETLLNTWHVWKFHDLDTLHRAKIDRQNLQRMQAIAYWMHHESGGTEADRQAVVSYKQLHEFLTKHVSSETPPNPDVSAEDIATAFLEFVQDRAGLLVEVGHRQFSFVHLTFQEYLTATHIKILSELNGVTKAWKKEVANHCIDPRWHEVIRLLVAGYGSNASQKFLVDKIFEGARAKGDRARLLAGLLLDGVAAAIERKEDVIESLVYVATDAGDNDISINVSALRACKDKYDPERIVTPMGIRSKAESAQDAKSQTRVRLVSISIGRSVEDTYETCGRGDDRECALFSLFLGGTSTPQQWQILEKDVAEAWRITRELLLVSPGGNLLATLLQTHAFTCASGTSAREAFDTQLASLSSSVFGWGPSSCLLFCNLLSADNNNLVKFRGKLAKIVNAHKSGGALRPTRDIDFDDYSNRARGLDLAFNNLFRTQVREQSLRRERIRHLQQFPSLERAVERALDIAAKEGFAYPFWRTLLADPEVHGAVFEFLNSIFDFQPKAHWLESLRMRFFSLLSAGSRLVAPEWWDETKLAFKFNRASEEEVYGAAWQLVFDGLLFIYGNHSDAASSKFAELSALTRDSKAAPLQIAHCIRDLAYGDKSGTKDLSKMAESDNPEYRKIFDRCFRIKDTLSQNEKKSSPRSKLSAIKA